MGGGEHFTEIVEHFCSFVEELFHNTIVSFFLFGGKPLCVSDSRQQESKFTKDSGYTRFKNWKTDAGFLRETAPAG